MMQRSSSSCSVFALLAATANALNTLTTTETSNGFNGPAMGWSTFGFQAINPTIPGWAPLVQSNVLEQCNMMASNSDLKGAGYKYCSLDSGWSADGADTYGRVLFQATNFPDFNTTFSKTLHDNGLLLGVYVVPGVIQSDVGKTIYKTDIKISDALQVQDGNHVDAGNDRYAFDYSKNGTQQWHDSVVALWASWGVDLIKLDYITPGSCNTNASYPACDLPGFPIDSSGTVEAYHTAIKNSGRPIRLDISWKLERNNTYYDIWRANADTMRMDQDINEGSGSAIFVKWATVQRAINNYREYIALQLPKNTPLSIYPDMDNMYVGNPAALSGVTDDQRTSIMSHWIGAAANLMIGSDLTALDTHGLALLTNPAALAVAAFTAQFPMQP
ncbi:Alpha-galactosidase 3, partial [Lachnellula cervina]